MQVTIVENNELQVIVETYDERIFIVDIDSLQDTIGSVKAKLETLEGTPMDQQTLIFGKIRLKDDNTLAHYRIRNNTTIKYRVKNQINYQINVMTLDGRNLTLDVQSTHTVNNIKYMIQERTATPIAMQSISFKGRNLDEFGDLYLTMVNVYNGATVHMIRRLVGYYHVLKLKNN